MSKKSKSAPGDGAPSIQLRVAHVWRDEVMDDQVFIEPTEVTLGSTKGATFTIPELGLPDNFTILRPGARGYVLTLGDGMGGTLQLDGSEMDVEDFIEGGGDGAAGKAGKFRATPVDKGDWGVIELDGSGDHNIFFQFVKPTLPLPRSGWRDPELLLPALAFALIMHTVFLAVSFTMIDGDNSMTFPGRRELMTAYLVKRPPPPEPVTEQAASKDGEVENIKPATAGDKGKSGGEGDEPRARDPEPVKDLPKNIQKGLLNKESQKIIKKVKFHSAMNDDLLRSVARLKGPKTAGRPGSGKGSGIGFGDDLGGFGTTKGGKGKGPGGGGAFGGDIVSKGKIDTGETRKPKGSGGKGRALKEKAVVGIGKPTGDFKGLSKAEIVRVVKSKSGLIRACYQRELNRTRGLRGKLLVNFRIKANGTVSSARVVGGKSTLRNAKVESCVKRQIMRLKFPAKGGGVVNYPFIFNQG